MLCWMTGTGIVTVAGVGAGVGVAVGVAVGVGDETGAAVPPLEEGDVSRADAAVRVSTAPATAIPPAARNCRLVATTDRMCIIFRAVTLRNDDACRHGIARSTGRRSVHINQPTEVNVKWSPMNTSTTSPNRRSPHPTLPRRGREIGATRHQNAFGAGFSSRSPPSPSQVVLARVP